MADKISKGGITTWGVPDNAASVPTVPAAVAAVGGEKKNPAGPAGLVTGSYKSSNGKTGPCMATYASQASCPDGHNNGARFRCPLYGSGCYAEQGPGGFTTGRLNKAGGVDRAAGKAKATPEDVARDEAWVIENVLLPDFKKSGQSPLRLHVVGDCVTAEAARIVSKAAEKVAYSLPGGAKSVWNYTHAWRSVSRSAWSSRISVLASCDDIRQLPEAYGKGYALAIVVPDYMQVEGKQYGASYESDNGFRLIPCPAEVGKKTSTGKAIQCVDCKLCFKDDWLRSVKGAIAFAAHGSKANTVAKQLVEIEKTELKKEKKGKGRK